jgi:PTS system N-acetylglucosamine-specific IIC component
MFNLLQRIGKALMTPIAVLPVAALLLRLGFGDIFDGQVALIMKSAGDAIFSNLDLLFGVGIAYGLAKNNDGAAALAGAIGVLIAKAVYISIDKDVNMGVFVGIIIGVLAGTLYNRFHDIKLPEFLGFFGGKRFVPIVTAVTAIFVGVLAGYFWHYAQGAIDAFSNMIIGLNEVGTFIYGTLNRLLIPLGLHHILNSVFWFQLGEYTHLKDGVEVVANGDLHRFFAGDKTAGVYMSGFYIVMMFGLPAMAYAIYLNTPKNYRKKAGAILLGVAFTSFLTGITEPLEFLFLFVAPLLFVYVINYKLATNPLLILPLGVVFALLYFVLSYYTIKIFKLKILETELQEDAPSNATSNEALAFIEALGGEKNILNTDACITRLRMSVDDSTELKDEDFMALGAKGVIRPDKKSIQIILGTKAEGVAESIKEALK